MSCLAHSGRPGTRFSLLSCASPLEKPGTVGKSRDAWGLESSSCSDEHQGSCSHHVHNFCRCAGTLCHIWSFTLIPSSPLTSHTTQTTSLPQVHYKREHCLLPQSSRLIYDLWVLGSGLALATEQRWATLRPYIRPQKTACSGSANAVCPGTSNSIKHI